jgi:hypothetical protein
VTECVECGQPDGVHLTSCALAPAPHEAVLREIRDEVRLLRRTVSYALVLLVLWMLVWAVLNGR